MLTILNSIIFVLVHANKTDICQIISTIVSVVTLFIAIRALYIWKDEIKAKRRYELTKELYLSIIKLEDFYNICIKNTETIDYIKLNQTFDKFSEKLREILLEYGHLIDLDNLKKVIAFFKRLTDKYDENYYSVKVYEKDFLIGSYSWEILYSDDGKKEFEENIKILKDFCKQEIQEFYSGKRNLKNRYDVKIYINYKKKRGKKLWKI